MRAADVAWIAVFAAAFFMLALGLEGCRQYRECRRGGVVLIDGPSRVAAPSHARCLSYVLVR